MTDTKPADGRATAHHGLWTRLYRGETAFDFVGRRRRWFFISGAIIVIGLISLFVRGLNFGIDFKGGTVWEVRSNASVAHVRDVLGQVDPAFRQATIEILTDRTTGAHTVRISAQATTTKDKTKVTAVSDALAKMAGVNINQVALNDVGPTWGHDITTKAERALVIFLALVVLYITFRFEGKMAIAALIALVHDILVTLGVYSISGFSVTPATVIAFLTILGYSLYDTIVVFDKIEENTKGLAATGRITYTETVNLSMNQVLMRSINTSIVAIMPILSILLIGAYLLGASALEDFGLALFIGLLTGAYSSIFIAAPALAVMKEREPRYAQIRQRLANRATMTGVLTPAAAASGELLGAAAGGGGGGGGRSRGGARAGAASAAGSGGSGGGSGGGRTRVAPRPPLKPAGLAAKASSSPSSAPSSASSSGPADDGGDLVGDDLDAVEVAPVAGRGGSKKASGAATSAAGSGSAGSGTGAGSDSGSASGAGGAGAGAGAGNGASGAARQAPKPKANTPNRTGGGGGGGGNRPGPRPRKKGRRR
ncbi:MAG TPA: protein translocase subunit SecF [Acidimicrobiales bacterium]|nr:protein translocase subunit SecF [Acidimicrobiales bacterium]